LRWPLRSRQDLAVRLRLLLTCFAATLLAAAGADAHPAPFSYLDIHLAGRDLSGSLVLHDMDVAHELGLATPESLMDPAAVAARRDAIVGFIASRLILSADGRDLVWRCTGIAPLPDRSAIELTWQATAPSPVGRLTILAVLFPYDPQHQTFVNVYEAEALIRQEVLGLDRASVDFYTRTTQGRFAVVKTFTASGVHHIAIGPDHILFVIGLLLLGGSVPRLLAIVSAFTVGHSVTLTLATLGVVNPPSHLVEPAIALSIVYVGADNLLIGSGGRDVRAWVALFFGLVHGFGFASVLRETGLPPRALGLSLFAFNLGVEIGQAIIVVTVASALGALRARNAPLAKRVAVGGSVIVTAAGMFWFVQRVM
jgi:hydrogenase/urease accessory protein HupE